MLHTGSTWIQTLTSLFAVVLAFWGIKIAAATARDQRDNRNFAAEKAASDVFEEQLFTLNAESFFAANTDPNSTSGFLELGEGQTRYTRTVKDMTLRGYFTARGVEILHAVRDWQQSKMELGEARLKVQSAKESIRVIVHNWPYPERRRDALIEIYEWMADNHYAENAVMKNRRLQIAQWMHTSYPSPSRVRQTILGWWLWLRVVLYDIHAGRMSDRFKTWRITRRESKAAQKKLGKPIRPRKNTLERW
jgi:hypothetical protein